MHGLSAPDLNRPPISLCAVQQYQAAQRRGWRGAYYLLSAYTSVLREFAEDPGKVDTSQDGAALRAIAHDRHAPLAHRTTAAFTHGIVLWGQGRRSEAVRKYRATQQLAATATEADNTARILASDPRQAGQAVWKPARVQIEENAQTASENMAMLGAGPSDVSLETLAELLAEAQTQSGQPGAAQRTVMWPVEPRNAAEAAAEWRRREAALSVRSAKCAQCGRRRGEGDAGLKRCQRCGAAHVRVALHVHWRFYERSPV